MTKYIASLWPNNQPPIVLGIYEAKNQNVAKVKAILDNEMKAEEFDNIKLDVYDVLSVRAFAYWFGTDWESKLPTKEQRVPRGMAEFLKRKKIEMEQRNRDLLETAGPYYKDEVK